MMNRDEKLKQAADRVLNGDTKLEQSKVSNNVDQFTIVSFITSNVVNKLNEVLKHEYNNSSIYHALSLWADSKGLFGAKEFFHRQAHEEHEHGARIKQYIVDMGGKAMIPSTDEFYFEFKDTGAALMKALETEIETTRLYYDLLKFLKKNADIMTEEFIRWFIKEQIEELARFRNLLDKWKSIGVKQPFNFDDYLKTL